MTVYRDNYPHNIESSQKLYIQYSHDISFDYSNGRYPDGTETEWHWETTYIPIPHKINGLDVGRHEWMRIRVGDVNFWTYPIRMSANITNIQTIESEVNGEGEFDFVIRITFEDGSIKESDPIHLKNGVDGVEIESALINEDGYLIITYSNGRVENAGLAKGTDGTGIPTSGDNGDVLSINEGVPYWVSTSVLLGQNFAAVLPIVFDPDTGLISHSNNNGYRHIPIGGTSGQVLSTDGNGNYTWVTRLTSETDPVFTASQAANITSQHITDLNNLSGINTGDQVGDGVTITGTGTVGDPFVANIAVDTDEKVKYDVNDPTAGYIADKFVAGEGINLIEGTGGNENKLEISAKTKIYQTLTSSASIAMSIANGVNAKVTLEHDATLTISGLINGSEGNIEITMGASDHDLIISPTPYVINDGGSTVTLLSGVGSKTVLSYSYDGSVLLLTYNKNSPISNWAGPITTPNFTPTVNPGEATISSIQATVFDNIDGSGIAEVYTIPEATFTFDDNSENWIIVNYNSGVPEYQMVDYTYASINGFSIYTVLVVWRQGTNLHSRDLDAFGLGLPNKTLRKIINTEPYKRSLGGGLILSESSRTVIVSEAIVWAGVIEEHVLPYNSSVDSLVKVTQTNGTWTYTGAQTVYQNTQYNPLTGPVGLGVNKYVNNYFYRSIGDIKEVFYMIGTNEYSTVNAAQLEKVPTPPILVRDHCVLVGRVTVQNGASSGTIQSAFDTTFLGSNVINHNETANIEGGDIVTPHYYHSDQPINTTNNVEFNTIKSTQLATTEVERGTDAKMGTGIPDEEKKKFKLVSSYNSGTNEVTLSLAFVGAYTSFNYYINNKRFTVTTGNIAAYTQTATVAERGWFFYINQNTTDAASPVVVLTQTAWGISDPDVLLWNGSWDNTNKEWLWVGHEKHTYGRDIFMHARNHAQGAIYRSGLLLSSYNGLTNTLLQSNTDNNFGRAIYQVAGGYFFDEDLKNGIAHSDTAISALSLSTAETDWDKFVYQFLGFTAIATTGTNSTTIVFPTSRTLATNQAITVMNGNTTTVRGTTTITTGGTGTSFTVASVTGLASGDAIVVGARIPVYYIDSVSGSNYTWRKLKATSFTGVNSQAATWTRSTTTITVTFNSHGMVTGDTILVSVSSDTGAIPLGRYSITNTGTNTFTIVGIDTGGASGTLTYNSAFNASTIASGVPQFNNTTSGRFSPLSSVRYFPVYLMATNFVNEPIIAVLGQGQSTNNNLTTALSEAPFQYNNLVGLAGLDIQEVVPFYRLTFRYDSGAGQNASRMRLVDATFLDIRVSTSSGAILSGGGASDHALLSNRGWTVSGHTGSINKLAGFGSGGEAVEYSNIASFDCTIGASGDYSTFGAAYTAGKRRMLQVGNITAEDLLESVTYTEQTYVQGNQSLYTITFVNNITRKITNCQFNNVKIVHQNSTVGSVFQGCEFNWCNVTFNGMGNTIGYDSKVVFNFCDIACVTIMPEFWNTYMYNCSVNDTISSVYNGVFINTRFIGSATTLKSYGVITTKFEGCIFENITSITSKIYAFLVNFNNCTFKKSVTNALNHYKYDGCVFDVNFSFSGDYNKIVNNQIIGTLTLSSGAEYNLIQGNTLSGNAIVDNSSNTTNVIKDNF